MARTISNPQLVVGIALLVAGVVLLATQQRIPWVTEAVGVVLVAAAVGVLYRGRMRPIGVALATVGVMLLLANRIENWGEQANRFLSIGIGILLCLLGILVLMGRVGRRRKDEPPAPKAEAEPA